MKLVNCEFKDILRDKYDYCIQFVRMTSKRENRIFYSEQPLSDWLNIHPQKENPNTPLFINKNLKPIDYSVFRLILKKAFVKAGFQNIKTNLSFFRYNRFALLIMKGYPEPLVKAYLGYSYNYTAEDIVFYYGCKQSNKFLLKVHGVKINNHTDFIN